MNNNFRNNKGRFIKGKENPFFFKKGHKVKHGKIYRNPKTKTKFCTYCKIKFLPEEFRWKQRFCTRQCFNKNLKNRVFTKEWKEKIRKSKLGNNNAMYGMRKEKAPNWQGGITPINQQIRCSLEYKLWREAVFKRDNWTCIWCKLKGGWSKKLRKRIILNADHIKQFAYYPELRFAIDNGRTLCVDCHKTTDTYLNYNKNGL